nr:uncharacterized protein LOC111994817 [Quercus suber]
MVIRRIFFLVGAQLSPQEKEELLAFLRRNVNVFAWNAYEAPGVDPDFICHYLNVNPPILPKKQPPWCLSKEHSNVVKEEVNKLRQAGAIKKVFYPECKAFRRYCGDLGITNRYSTPAYPQGNGQAETVNKVIVSRLKKRLDDTKEKWVEELPHVLWTYRITPLRSTGEMPFLMTYRAEAVIPLETGFPTLRTNSFTSSSNDGLLEKSLDLIEDRRENAMVQLAYYKHKLK